MKFDVFAKLGRYFVPDLSPEARGELGGSRPRFVFVAESPHITEIAPACLAERRPLCGKAGEVWWGALSGLLEGPAKGGAAEKGAAIEESAGTAKAAVAGGSAGTAKGAKAVLARGADIAKIKGAEGIASVAKPATDVSLDRLEYLCRKYRFAVINAVQYPLDPKVAAAFPDAVPSKTIGFSKEAGPSHYKKMKSSPPMKLALASLRKRLQSKELAACPIYCLGHDAQWFIAQALGVEEFEERMKGRIPHPSAWWRKGGLFGRNAREQLEGIFGGG